MSSEKNNNCRSLNTRRQQQPGSSRDTTTLAATAATTTPRTDYARQTQSLRRCDDRRFEVKRILLTRRYKHHNIYNDLGVRVVGGKRQRDGELAAYVSAVNGKMQGQTMGQIKLGDEVLEWNGVLLRGKTFEEVERIVNSSQGEVEVIIQTERHHFDHSVSLGRTNYAQREELSPERVPPVPMHRVNGNNNHATHAPFSESASGHLQVALSYDSNAQRLAVRIMRARGLRARDPSRAVPNPFVKIYLLPGRKVSHKRRTRFVDSSCDPEWNQLLEYQVPPQLLKTMFLEFSICDYERDTDDLPLGHVQINLSDPSILNGSARWYPIQSETTKTRAARRYEHNYDDSKVTYKSSFNYNPASLDIGYPAIN